MVFEMVPIQTEIVIKGFHSIYYFELDKNFYHPPEQHDFWEMVYVDQGKIISVAEGIGSVLTQGQVVFHKPMEQHAHISNKKDSNNILVVSFTCHSGFMSFFNKKIFHLEKGSKKLLSLFMKEAENAMAQIPNQYENKSPLDFSKAAFGSVQLMQCYLTEFLFSLIRSNSRTITSLKYTEQSKRIAENSLVGSIRQYLANNISQPLTLEDICKEFMMSKAALCRVFKAETGSSPICYFIELKMQEAKKLIREDCYNITQISEQLGYGGIHHFSRAFKRSVGFSPLAYKKSLTL